MADTNNTTYSYKAGAIGGANLKQQWDEVIHKIAVDEGFLHSRMGSTDIKQVSYNWLKDTVDPAKSNTALEGADFVPQTVKGRRSLSNGIQHLTESFYVTDVSEKALKQGITSEIAYQSMKKAEQITNDIEYAVINNSFTRQDNGTLPAVMGGIPYFVGADAISVSNVAGLFTFANHNLNVGEFVLFYINDGAGAALPAVSTGGNLIGGRQYYIRPDAVDPDNKFTIHPTREDANMNTNAYNLTDNGTGCYVTKSHVVSAVGGSISESLITDLQQSLHDRGIRKTQNLICSYDNLRVIAGLLFGSVTVNKDQKDKSIYQAVDTIVTNFGTVNTSGHSMYKGKKRIDMLNLDEFGFGYFLAPRREELARTGTARKFAMSTSIGLKCFNPVANGTIIYLDR
jgi:hypothetical protein